MKIGSYLFHYPQPCGTTFAARGLSRGLAKLGHNVKLYCCGEKDGKGEEHLANREVVHFTRSGIDHPFRVPKPLLNRLRRNEDGLDLLLIHGNFNPRNVAVAAAARRGGIPYIVCPSSLYHPELFGKRRFVKNAYWTIFEKPMLKSALALQVFASSQAAVLNAFGVTRPVFVVPNGFDPSEVPEPETVDVAQNLIGDPRILFLGRIDMHTKGLDLLIRGLALGISNKRLPSDLCINLVGPDWGDRAKLAQLSADLGISENVKFFGRVDERWAVLFASDIVVLASRHDSFPTTVIEALAASKAVIVSEETGVAESIQQHGCGFVVKPEVESICTGLEHALEKRSLWSSMGERGRAFVHDSLNWESIAKEASSRYQQLPGLTLHHEAMATCS
jgi:glycosyltransferase involved in cell wall biosynthesis